MTTDVDRPGSCHWCGGPFTRNALGRPRRYCSIACRQEASHHREDLPGRQARLAYLEASAAGYRVVPSFIANEIDALHRALAAGPKVRQ